MAKAGEPASNPGGGSFGLPLEMEIDLAGAARRKRWWLKPRRSEPRSDTM
jgi:hypothetical protein